MAEINQKEYLKKYLSIGTEPGTKKKRKKKKTRLGDRVKIIDDDVDVSNSFNITEEELFAANEDAPQIVGIVDERPPELRIADYRQSDVWQPVGEVVSPPRKGQKIKDISPKMKRDLGSPRRKGSPSNQRNAAARSEDLSPPRKKERVRDDSPLGEKNRQGKSQKSMERDLSPPRRKRSPSYQKNSAATSEDLSPPRKRERVRNDSPFGEKNRQEKGQKSMERDLSPPRRKRSPSYQKNIDLSPPRKKERVRDDGPLGEKNQQPRNKNISFSVKKIQLHRSKTSESGKMKKTLDGKTAGLQNAKDLVVETEKFKDRENALFKNLSEEQSGASAATIVRDRKTGKIRNLEEEQEEQRRKQEEENKNKEKYIKWGRGLKQVDDINEKIAQDLHEMSKPLARYADDEDLEKFLKEQERDDDPMLAYIRKKKKKEAVASGKPLKPIYEGEFMPNRFGIRPGYRWDGVDRSNGYEKKWFEVQNAKRAQQEEVYKWSTEDM